MERNVHMQHGSPSGAASTTNSHQLSNRHWPDAFGFGLWGLGPCFVISVEKASIAHKAGILPGDQLLEIDGHDVANMSIDSVRTLARHSATVPPTVGVVTRLQYIEIVPNRQLGYGFTVTGAKPVVVQSINPFGPGYQSGLREGDLILQVNGHYVRTCEAVQTLLASHYGKMILGILAFERAAGVDNQLGLPSNEVRLRSPHTGSRVKKARDLFGKMNDMLGSDYEKKMAVVGVLKQYAEDRNVERLSKALALLLNAPKHRNLIREIRPFIPIKHRKMFDTILGIDTNSTDYSSANDQPESLRYKTRSRTPDLTQGNIKTVTIDRRDGSFGFILRGSNPVYIESVDINGAADRAGLKAGQCILKLNGLDVRKCGHAHLVKLLQGSGNRPTFEVMQMVDRDGIPIIPGSAASSDTASTSSYDESSSWLKETSRIVDKDGRTFRQRADHLLTKKEKDNLRRALTRYNNTRDVATFFEDVTSVFDTPSKTTLWMFLIPKLANEHRDYCLQRINVPRELLLENKKLLCTNELQSSEIEYTLDSHYPADVYPLDQRAKLRQDSKRREDEVEEIGEGMLHVPSLASRGSIISQESGSGMSWMADVREMNHVGSFKQQLEYLLTSRERLELKNALQIYTKNRSVDNLIEDASVILDTPSKRTLWLYIIPLLPDDHQETCRGSLSIPVNLVNQMAPSFASSYTSDSDANQSLSVSECSSVSDENNTGGNRQSANPKDGDVMFHSEDDFNFIGKAAALLKDSGDRMSLGSLEDVRSHRNQYSPNSPSPYKTQFWRSTPDLAHVDEQRIRMTDAPLQNRKVTLPPLMKVNGHGTDERIEPHDDNFFFQAPRNGMSNQHEDDLPHPINNYQVREIDEDDPMLLDILPPEARGADGKVVIVQTDIPPRAHSQSQLTNTYISPVHSPSHQVPSSFNQNLQSSANDPNFGYFQGDSPMTSHIGSPTSSISHAYSLESSPQPSNRGSPYMGGPHQVPHPRSPLIHSHQSTPVRSGQMHGSPFREGRGSPDVSAQPNYSQHNNLPGDDGQHMNYQGHGAPYNGELQSQEPHQYFPYNVHTYHEGQQSGHTGPPPSEPYQSYPQYPQAYPLPHHHSGDTCPQCGSHPNQATTPVPGSGGKSLSSQDSFIEKAKDAIQALDDAVGGESDDDSSESQKETVKGNVPVPPPPPPLPPAPPPLPKHLKEQKENYPMYVKRLNWEKLDISNMKETVWGQLGDSGYLQDVVKYLELEHKFSTKRTEIVSKAKRVNKNQVSILNAKKAYNTSILLGHLKMSVIDLKNALYRIDEEIFTPELIQQMLAYSPNEEEIEKYDHYNGLTEDLSKPDQFGFEMSRMPGYTQKLKAMLFKANFAEKVEELKETLNCIKRASQELLNSKKLTKMIEMVLAMGNYMNQGNSRIGEAAAFKITYLSQLDTTKTTDGKATFLHVLSKAIMKTHPEITTFRDELPSIASASKVRYCPMLNSVTGMRTPDFCISIMAEVTSDSIAQELNDLKKVLQDISNTVSKHNAFNAVIKDRFHEVMGHFIAVASDEIQGLYSMQATTVAEFNTMLKYFGEDPNSSTANDIFKIFADFLGKIERAHQENLMHERHH